MKNVWSIFVYSMRSMARRLRVDFILTSAEEVTPGGVFSLGPLKFRKDVTKPGVAKYDKCD